MVLLNINMLSNAGQIMLVPVIESGSFISMVAESAQLLIAFPLGVLHLGKTDMGLRPHAHQTLARYCGTNTHPTRIDKKVLASLVPHTNQ